MTLRDRSGVQQVVLSGILIAATAVAAAAPSAQTEALEPGDDPSREVARALDPSSRVSSALQSHGLSFELSYVGETFSARRLVPADAVEYRGNLNLHLGLDTGAAGWWKGGEFFFDLQNGHGHNLALVQDGVFLPLSNIDSPDFTQVYQWGVAQRFARGRVRLRLGKQDTNDIFAVNALGADFISPPFTLIPTVPLPTFPAPALGAALFVDPNEAVTVGMGFFDGGPEIGGLGFGTFLDGSGGYFSCLEPVLRIKAGAGHDRPGTYRLSLWHHSGPFPSTTADQQGRVLMGNHGAVLEVNQMLSPQSEEGQPRGVGVFLQLGWAPADRSPVSRYLGVGFTYNGVVPKRDADFLAVGVGLSTWNLFDPPGVHEQVRHVEVFYVAHLSSWASLQPDVQLFSPGSDGAAPAWAFGLRWLLAVR